MDALLLTYSTHKTTPSGDVAPCVTRSGVPGALAFLAMVAAGAAGYIAAGVESDRKAREAYALGLSRAPKPRLY